MLSAKQSYPSSALLDPAQAVEQEVERLRHCLRPGMRVALGVGSRGITGLQRMVGALVRKLQAMGTHPFIVPAMGSHGGATPEGQTELLAEYGITETALGVPIRAAMEADLIGTTPEGVKAFCSIEALGSDAIILVNRIKPHTDFAGRLGSGILKMAVIGLGKRTGAANFHVAASQWGYEEVLRSVSRVVLAKAPVIGGLAIIENQRHETCRLAAIGRSEIEMREEALFMEAKRLMPRLPFDDIDLLIVDRIGKNLSGAGLDPNIIGRSVHGYSSFLGQKDLPAPRIKRIFVRDLTPETHGNAIGIGFADITTTRLVNAIDKRATYVNALTALTPNGAKIPIHFDTDQEALSMALQSVGIADTRQARVVRIADTLSLERLEVSEACAAECTSSQGLEIKQGPEPIRWNGSGNLIDFPSM
ncbi:MAG: lactate racemase domain-containing protein [Verrucomicrobiota bacterium]